MKYAIYLRVSTNEQDPDSQRHALQARAALLVAEGHTVEWREEKASGKTMDRPVMQGIMADLRAGALDGLLIHSVSRLGRTTSGLASAFDEFVQRRQNLISLREGVDLSTAAGRLVANIMAALAQHEREQIIDRTRDGIAAKRARGEKWPGGTAKRGKTYAITAEQIHGAKVQRAAGTTVAEIARSIGCSRGTVARALEG